MKTSREGETANTALDGLMVVEFAEGIAGPVCGKLMAGLGADVIKVEPSDGDRSRTVGPFPNDVPNPEASGLYLYLNTGKKGVTLDLRSEEDRNRFYGVCQGADVIINGSAPDQLGPIGLGYDDLTPDNPGLVMVSITPFGRTGPYKNFEATNLVVHALSGELYLAGSNRMPPLKKGGHLAGYHAGLHGFIGAMAALMVRERTSKGQHVDVTHLESLTSILGATVNSWLYDKKISGRGDADPWSLGTAAQRGTDGTRWGPSGVWKAEDGHVLTYGRASADWAGMFQEISKDTPGFADPKYATTKGRDAHVDELNVLFRAWISAHTKGEVYRTAQRYGHAYGYVATTQDLLESPQLRHRNFFVKIDHPVAGEIEYPGAPFIMSRTPFEWCRAPLLGEHNDTVLLQDRHEAKQQNIGKGDHPVKMPLEGLRVLDFTHVWAGPYCTRILGDLGAEVIKVESISRGDGGRGRGVARFHAYSRNKLGLTLDLRTDEGRKHIRKLIGMSDVVVENFSVGVMKRLGIDYDECQKIRTDIVYIALPAFGRTGPEARFVGMGATQEAMSGLLSVSGYPGGASSPTGVKYGDPNGGVFGAVAALSALWHRRRTGEGQLIDLSQREANIFTLPDPIFEYSMNGRTAKGHGNRHPRYAPRGCYRSESDDMWVAIDVETDDQFKALCEIMKTPELAKDPRFAQASLRKGNEDALDELIENWTKQRTSYQAMHLLQDAGIPAGAVLTNQQVIEDSHFAARGFFEEVDHEDIGVHTHLSAPWKFSETPVRVRLFAPGLGQHNQHILGEMLGVTQSEIESMERKNVIGTKPLDL